MRNEKITSNERLQHVLKAIEKIMTQTKGISEKEFVDSEMIHGGCLSQFLIIREAIIHVDEHYLNKYEYPWYKVRAFRNLIAHEYFCMKLTAVWSIIENDLATLKETIETILKNEF